nr:MAG TPA: hypothetical protein [Caudoviricetes sp.]
MSSNSPLLILLVLFAVVDRTNSTNTFQFLLILKRNCKFPFSSSLPL